MAKISSLKVVNRFVLHFHCHKSYTSPPNGMSSCCKLQTWWLPALPSRGWWSQIFGWAIPASFLWLWMPLGVGAIKGVNTTQANVHTDWVIIFRQNGHTQLLLDGTGSDKMACHQLRIEYFTLATVHLLKSQTSMLEKPLNGLCPRLQISYSRQP